MLFPIYLNDKSDLTKFRQHALRYISRIQEVSYQIHLPDFRVQVNLACMDGFNSNVGELWMEDLKRNQENDIITCTVIVPSTDTRLKDFSDIQAWFPADSVKHYICSNSVEETVDKICTVIKILSKINHLKAFL
jgi:hypothetical protein